MQRCCTRIPILLLVCLGIINKTRIGLNKHGCHVAANNYQLTYAAPRCGHDRCQNVYVESRTYTTLEGPGIASRSSFCHFTQVPRIRKSKDIRGGRRRTHESILFERIDACIMQPTAALSVPHSSLESRRKQPNAFSKSAYLKS